MKTWNLADIISAAMTAGGDDPSEFVVPLAPDPTDWFHNNGIAYNRADDSLVVSSRENFLICLDYETLAIKWILGDPTKKWYQFPSLAQFALTSPPGSLPPIGQHAPSITFDQDLLVFDNGFGSLSSATTRCDTHLCQSAEASAKFGRKGRRPKSGMFEMEQNHQQPDLRECL